MYRTKANIKRLEKLIEHAGYKHDGRESTFDDETGNYWDAFERKSYKNGGVHEIIRLLKALKIPYLKRGRWLFTERRLKNDCWVY